MTEKKTDAKEPQAPTVAQINEAPPQAENKELLEEFYKTHRLRPGYAYNPHWPEKIRKVQ